MTPTLPPKCLLALRRQGLRPGKRFLTVSVAEQSMTLWEVPDATPPRPSLPYSPAPGNAISRSDGNSPYPFRTVGTVRTAARVAFRGAISDRTSSRNQSVRPVPTLDGPAGAARRFVSASAELRSNHRSALERGHPFFEPFPHLSRRRYLISTSRFGLGQTLNSYRTPLGLHRIARKIGGGHPIGTVFRHRQPIGFTWQGQPEACIAHRIFWLDGLEPGFNLGGPVDTFRRYIYIHGFGDETTLGRPQSRGCIHMAAADLMPLFDLLPVGTLVWIGER